MVCKVGFDNLQNVLRRIIAMNNGYRLVEIIHTDFIEIYPIRILRLKMDENSKLFKNNLRLNHVENLYFHFLLHLRNETSVYLLNVKWIKPEHKIFEFLHIL